MYNKNNLVPSPNIYIMLSFHTLYFNQDSVQYSIFYLILVIVLKKLFTEFQRNYW